MLATIQPFQCQAAALIPAAWLRWLGAALAARPGPPVAPPADDWTDVLPAISAHQLAPLLYTRRREPPARALTPAPLLDALAAAFQDSALRSLRMELALQDILAGLAAADVPCLLLKGAAVGRAVYGSPAERPVSDLDLLVPRGALAAAQTALTRQGYRIRGLSAGGPLGRAHYRYKAECPALGSAPANQGLLVELHWTLTELPYVIDRIRIAELWRAAQPVPGLPDARMPDPAGLLIHACAHLALHHSRDLRLIWLVDLDRLARQAALDWDRVVRLAADWGLGLAVMAGLEVAGRWLGTPTPAEVRAALADLAGDSAGRAMWGLGDEALAGRWWRRAWTTWAAFDGRQRGRYAAWLALRAASRPLEWLSRR